MTRVTIKELQIRLDEMRTQRDEARASANRLKGLEAEAEKAYQLKSEMDACNELLDATNGQRIGGVSYHQNPVAYMGVAMDRPLHARLANLLIRASTTAGKLEQADLMRREALGLDLFGQPFGKNP